MNATQKINEILEKMDQSHSGGEYTVRADGVQVCQCMYCKAQRYLKQKEEEMVIHSLLSSVF